MRIALRLLLAVLILCLLYPAVVLALYFFSPRENATLRRVDTLIVLGCPAEPDGSPSPEQRERVMEGVREFDRGVSNHIIMTGTAAHNQFVEANVMARLAEANGVPATAIFKEDRAHDTIQNIYYSNKIMNAHGWHTAEVISSPYHLARTAMILSHYPDLKWETHAAHWPPAYALSKRIYFDWREALLTFRIRIHGFRRSKYLPK